MYQFLAIWFVEHRKLNLSYDFSSFLLCCNPGDLPKHHLELGEGKRNISRRYTQKSIFHFEDVTSLRDGPCA